MSKPIEILHFKKQEQGSLLGYLSVQINNKAGEPAITIYNCRLVSGSNGNFVSMPSRKDQKEENKYWPFIRLHNEALQQKIVDAAMEAYNNAGGGGGQQAQTQPSPSDENYL